MWVKVPLVMVLSSTCAWWTSAPLSRRRSLGILQAEVGDKGLLRPDQMESALRDILKAVDEGREGEIEGHVAGVKIRRLKDKTPNERLMENLADPEVRARLTEPSDPEEMLLMAQLRQDLKRVRKSLGSGPSTPGTAPIDESLSSVASEILAEMAGSRPQVSLLEEMDRMEAQESDDDDDDDDGDRLIPLSPLDSDASADSPLLRLPDPAASTARMDEFAALLRTAMGRANETEASEDAVSSTVAAVESGNMAALDLGALIGETLSSISAEAGLDVKRELSSNPEQLQSILQSSIAELGNTMREIDSQSADLYTRLGRLEQELRAETEAFEERKQLELSDLLNDQNRLGRELQMSRESMLQSTSKLNDLMKTYEEQADFLTCLALFPLKSADKKAAFVVGLALLFKVPFDAIRLFAVRGAETSELTTLFAQAAIAFLCFLHYGIIAAMGRKPMDI